MRAPAKSRLHQSPKRATSMNDKSIAVSPSKIHSDNAKPTPPPCAMPLKNPQATKKPGTPGKWTDQAATVGSERDGTVDDALDAGGV